MPDLEHQLHSGLDKMWSTLVACYSYRTFKLSVTRFSSYIYFCDYSNMLQAQLFNTKRFFCEPTLIFFMVHKTVLKITYIIFGATIAFWKPLEKNFVCCERSRIYQFFNFFLNYTYKFPSIKSCDQVKRKLIKEAGSVLMMIKNANMSDISLKYPLSTTPSMYICYHFFHLWPVYLIRYRY